MANLLAIVRPQIPPDIRPKVSVVDFPQADPETDPSVGRTILSGNDGQVISLSYNFSRSMQKGRSREEKRKYDIARVYKVKENQAGEATGVDKSTFVDVEIPHKILMRDRNSRGPLRLENYRKPKDEDYPNGNVEIKEEDLVRENKIA